MVQDRKSFKQVYEKDHKKTNYVETMMHLLKANVGTGCFALGASFKYGGIILGPILLCFIAVITVHAQHLLIKCADFLKNRNDQETPLSYSETIEGCFLNSKSEKLSKLAAPMRKICTSSICIAQLGFCCVYLLFVASNIKELGDFYGSNLSLHVWITIAVVPIWMSVMIRTLKVLGE
jgi:proton-coupled amino acid transporter